MLSNEDSMLIKLLKDGDYDAFEKLFRKYRPVYLRFIRGMVKDDNIADDIAQNIFLKVWTHRESLDETLSLPAYLYVLAKYEIYNHFRSLRIRKTTAFSQVATSALLENPSIHTPHEELSFNELNAKVTSLIESMPPKRRQIFMMSRFDDMTSKEIGAQLGISPRTVEKHIELAMKDLRSKIQSPVLLLFFMMYYSS